MTIKRTTILQITPGNGGGVEYVARQIAAEVGKYDEYRILLTTTTTQGGRVCKALYGLAAYVRIAWLLLFRRIDIVHIHQASNWSFWRKLPVYAMARYLKKRVVMHLHGSLFSTYCWKAKRLKRRLLQWVLRTVRVRVTPSQWQAREMRRVTGWEFHIIKNPVEAVADDDIPERYNPGDDKLYALYVGDISRAKGVADLIEVARRTEDLPITYMLVGRLVDADLVPCLEAAKNIEYSDYIDNRCLCYYFSIPNLIFVHLSHLENQCIAVLEAMMWGLPIIATNVGDNLNLIGDRGWFVNVGDITEIEYLLRKIIIDPGNIEHAQYRGKVARRYALEHHAAHIIGRHWRDVYETMMED